MMQLKMLVLYNALGLRQNIVMTFFIPVGVIRLLALVQFQNKAN